MSQKKLKNTIIMHCLVCTVLSALYISGFFLLNIRQSLLVPYIILGVIVGFYVFVRIVFIVRNSSSMKEIPENPRKWGIIQTVRGDSPNGSQEGNQQEGINPDNQGNPPILG